MLIEHGKLERDALRDQVAVVTGAGRGIGFETCRALLCLGARVVIAEVDEVLAQRALAALTAEFADGRALAVQTDVGDEADVARLHRVVQERFGQVDIVINNATVTPMGAVWSVPVDQWDHSYRVNLRGPVLLAQRFIPAMLERNYGVFACVSSVGEAYMGAYESFKAAQVHLASTLDAELEGTGVCAFAIGPGLVRTPGAEAGIRDLAPLYGKTVEEFYALSAAHIITVEEAAAGFAAAVALASQFRGQEISSRQALIAAGIPLDTGESSQAAPEAASSFDPGEALTFCRTVRNTLAEQSEGWSKRSLFERQWMFRDFKKNAGMPVEHWLDALAALEVALASENPATARGQKVPLHALAGYYEHMMDLARGYEKDPEKLERQLSVMREWVDDVNALNALLN